MRVQAYILTFLAYTMMHSLRTGYSQSKAYFKQEYDFSKTFLAVLDSSIYFAMGAGFFFRYFFLNNKDIIYSFFLTGMVFIISFALFPLLSIAGILDGGDAGWISLILMVLFGFFQMNCWPVSLLLVSEYFTNEQDGGLIGFWTCAGSIGNILGYIFPSLLVLSLHLPWQVPLLILCAVLLLSTLSVYLFVDRANKVKQKEYL
jgi:sugar phosphate permease